MIKLSDMRNRIIVQKAEVSMDETGNRTNAYTDYCTRWAYINKHKGREEYEAAKTAEKETVQFVIRFDTRTRRITPGRFRILFNEKIYNIIRVDNFKMRNESLTITAEEMS